jgi:inner membrane protein
MLEWLQSATGAHWVVAGLVLLIAEVFLPGAFLMWLGFGAVLTGVLAWLIPGLTWQAEALIFVVLSIGSILAFRRWRARNPERPTDQPLLNKRVAQLVGRVFDLGEPIVNGRGRLKIGDALWTVTGPDLPTGTKIRVDGARDGVLDVVPIDQGMT